MVIQVEIDIGPVSLEHLENSHLQPCFQLEHDLEVILDQLFHLLLACLVIQAQHIAALS